MENENIDTIVTLPEYNKYLRIGGYFLASVILLAIGATGFWIYQAKVANSLISTKDKKSAESPLYIWGKYIDKQYPEFNSISIFYNKDGDSNFYFLYKGKVYFDEPKEDYNLDVLKKEGWRQIMTANSNNNFKLSGVKSGYYEQAFFITNCQEENCGSKGYKVFHYKWGQPYYENNPPSEIYNSNKDTSYAVPRIDENSQDGKYLSLLLYQCSDCGGHDPKTVLINLSTREVKELGFVKDFSWQKSGKYSFRKVVYQKCSFSEDKDCNPEIGNLKLVETKMQQGQFDKVEYQDKVTLSN